MLTIEFMINAYQVHFKTLEMQQKVPNRDEIHQAYNSLILVFDHQFSNNKLD